MDRPSVKTTTWTSDELSRIEAAQELKIAPRRRDRPGLCPPLVGALMVPLVGRRGVK
jgi:hypothetical protein